MRRRLAFEVRAVRTTLFVFCTYVKIDVHTFDTLSDLSGGFISCWLPYAIMIFIGGFINPELISPLLTTVLSLLTKTSFVSNSLIYVMRNQNLRRHLLPLFKRHSQSHEPCLGNVRFTRVSKPDLF